MADTATEEAAQQKADSAGDDSVQVQEAELPEVSDQQTIEAGGQIDILLETEMPVSVSLGGVTLQVQQLLQLAPGSVLKLDRQVGEPVDLLLRGTRFATGQLVVVGDRLGVRITEVLSQAEESEGDEKK